MGKRNNNKDTSFSYIICDYILRENSERGEQYGGCIQEEKTRDTETEREIEGDGGSSDRGVHVN